MAKMDFVLMIAVPFALLLVSGSRVFAGLPLLELVAFRNYD